MVGADGVAWPCLLARLGSLIELDGSALAQGALRRRRGVGDAATLLRLALVYGGTGLSLRATASWAAAAGVARLSDVALMYRLQGAQAWLGWLVGELLSKELGTLGAGVAAGAGWKLRLVDGSGIATARSPGRAVFKLHASFDLAARRFDRLELTDGPPLRGVGTPQPHTAAESLARHAAGPGEVLVADRFYAKARGIHAIAVQGGHVVIRRGLTGCRLTRTDGTRLDAKAVLALARSTPALDLPVLVLPPEGACGAPVRARLILRRKPTIAAERARARALRDTARRRYVARPKQLEAASVLMLMTTLPTDVPADTVCAIYRLRWQIELAFKRLKSLIGIEQVDAREPRLARAAVYARLILAILTESLLGRVLALSPTPAA